MSERPKPLDQRLLAAVALSDEGCWVWQRKVNRGGYGVISVRKDKQQTAHRASYETFRGPIPDGLVIDHLCHTRENCEGGPTCRHRRCINPDHMAVVAQRENARRGHVGRVSRTTVECSDHVIKIGRTGRKYCTTCDRRRGAVWRARQAAA